MSLKNSILKEAQVLYNVAPEKAGRPGAGGLMMVIVLLAMVVLSFAVELVGATEHNTTPGGRVVVGTGIAAAADRR